MSLAYSRGIHRRELVIDPIQIPAKDTNTWATIDTTKWVWGLAIFEGTVGRVVLVAKGVN